MLNRRQRQMCIRDRVLAGHLDLTSQEPVVIHLESRDLVGGQQSAKVDVAALPEVSPFVVADQVLVTVDPIAHTQERRSGQPFEYFCARLNAVSISRSASRSAMFWRLSPLVRPFANPSSIFARPFFQ